MRLYHFGLIAVLLSGCASVPQQDASAPVQRSVAGPADAVRARAERALREAGFAAERAPGGGLRAVARGAPDPAWSDCRPVVVRDENNEYVRSDWARPGARQTAVSVALQPAGSGRTEVTVATETVATYNDRFRALPFQESCATTGALERRVLDAVAAAG